jgi:hypothetical protein
VQFGSRQAVEEYRAVPPEDDPEEEDLDPEAGPRFFEEVGLRAGWCEDLEVRHEPELWRQGEGAFRGLSWSHLLAPGAARVVSDLGLAPFDTVLMVWGYHHQSFAEPGARTGRVRFVGSFDLLPEPG